MGQFEPVHRARHVYIREDEPDFRMLFEHTDSFLGISRFVNKEALVL
jgi:hypothetical protein